MENKTNFLSALNKLYVALDKSSVIPDINNGFIQLITDSNGRILLVYNDGERSDGIYIDNLELVSDFIFKKLCEAREAVRHINKTLIDILRDDDYGDNDELPF